MALIYCNNAWRVVPTICERIFYIWSRPTEQHCALINSHRTSYLEKKKAHWLGIQIDGTQFFAACSSLWIQQRIPGEFILASAWWKISSHNRSSTVGGVADSRAKLFWAVFDVVHGNWGRGLSDREIPLTVGTWFSGDQGNFYCSDNVQNIP